MVSQTVFIGWLTEVADERTMVPHGSVTHGWNCSMHSSWHCYTRLKSLKAVRDAGDVAGSEAETKCWYCWQCSSAEDTHISLPTRVLCCVVQSRRWFASTPHETWQTHTYTTVQQPYFQVNLASVAGQCEGPKSLPSSSIPPSTLLSSSSLPFPPLLFPSLRSRSLNPARR